MNFFHHESNKVGNVPTAHKTTPTRIEAASALRSIADAIEHRKDIEMTAYGTALLALVGIANSQAAQITTLQQQLAAAQADEPDAQDAAALQSADAVIASNTPPATGAAPTAGTTAPTAGTTAPTTGTTAPTTGTTSAPGTSTDAGTAASTNATIAGGDATIASGTGGASVAAPATGT